MALHEHKNDLVGIQHLRGVAASAVVVTHASGMAAFAKYFGVMVGYGLLRAGNVGVDLFFGISGFIITYVSLNSQSLSPKLGMRDFFGRRFNRIVPLMWVSILSYLALRFLGRGAAVGDLTAYVRAFFLLPFGSVEPKVIWTLRHEAIFYAIFALSFLGSRPRYWLIGA